MNDDHASLPRNSGIDRKIETDWAAVLDRLADLNSRSGGDNRRRAILERLERSKRSS